MSKEIVIPDYLKGMVDESQLQSENLISAAGSVPRISLKGMKFRFQVDGEEIERVKDKIHMVILGVQPERHMAKTFYLEDYNTDDTSPPDCSSSDGVRPDIWISDPQNDSCAKCKQNVWGSAKSITGGKAKKCRDSKRLMVVKAQDIGGVIFILNVTVASLKNLSIYGKELVKNSVPLAAAITTVKFDEESEYPKLEFEFAGILKEKHGKAALIRSGEKEWDTFSQQQIASDSKPETKQLSSDKEQDAPKKEKKVKKDKKTKKDKPVKGELVEKESDSLSDVDDLLDGWGDDD